LSTNTVTNFVITSIIGCRIPCKGCKTLSTNDRIGVNNFIIELNNIFTNGIIGESTFITVSINGTIPSNNLPIKPPKFANVSLITGFLKIFPNNSIIGFIAGCKASNKSIPKLLTCAFILSIEAANVFIFFFACSLATFVPVSFFVNVSTAPACSNRIFAAFAFSNPNICSAAVASTWIFFSSFNLADNGKVLSETISKLTPSLFNLSMASFGNNSSPLNLARTFLNEVPASAP